MKKNEFLGIMQELNIIYGERKFPLTAQTLEIWNRYLGEYDATDIHEAVSRHVKKSAFPPTVSELIEEYKNIQGEILQKASEVNTIFWAIVAAYPCATGGEREKEAFARLTGGDLDNSQRALAITRNIVLGWELSGEKHIPPLHEFLGRIKL